MEFWFTEPEAKDSMSHKGIFVPILFWGFPIFLQDFPFRFLFLTVFVLFLGNLFCSVNSICVYLYWGLELANFVFIHDTHSPLDLTQQTQDGLSSDSQRPLNIRR